MAATRSAGVRRLMREAAELSQPTDMYVARPLEDNLFEWHFTIRGPPDSPYEGGIYHGRIILPHDYPMKPPNLMMLTPNGRFETHTKICLSISAYHPETWLPSWSIGTALVALIAFMTTPGKGALGAIDCNDEQRKKLAKESLTWKCPDCGCNMKEIFDLMQEQASKKPKDPVSGDATNLLEASSEPQTIFKSTDAHVNIPVLESSPTPALENPVKEKQSQPSPSPPTIAIPKPMTTPPKANPLVHRRQQQPQPVEINSSSTTGLLIFIFSAIFFALLYRRLTSM